MTINSITPLNVKADKKVGIILPPLTGSRLDINGTMKLEGNGCSSSDQSVQTGTLMFAALNNTKGIIKLTGEQSTQTIPVLTAKKSVMVVLYIQRSWCKQQSGFPNSGTWILTQKIRKQSATGYNRLWSIIRQPILR